MKKINLIILLSAVCIFYVSCKGLHHLNSDELASNKADSLDIYLLIGQSNMAGRAPIEEQDKDTLRNVYLFTGNAKKQWEKAANPLNAYSSVRKRLELQKLNPGYTFAKKIALKSKRPIGLVVNAKGGTKIELWAPGTDFFNEAVARTKEAMKNGRLKGIIWHQGEANSSKYKQYMPQITALIKALRTEFNQADLPFVAGQLSADKEARKDFNKMILTLPQELDCVGVVTSEKTSTIDKTHFDSGSQREMGRRYAKEMIKLLH
ncbi:sialate O-acetylesterase [Labilibaculum sp.]|uniref:sialate O-acetylesterase n=1 Tax=Labilibaculum sp. TaxID=2060723 RepID=UPI00356700A1